MDLIKNVNDQWSVPFCSPCVEFKPLCFLRLFSWSSRPGLRLVGEIYADAKHPVHRSGNGPVATNMLLFDSWSVKWITGQCFELVIQIRFN